MAPVGLIPERTRRRGDGVGVALAAAGPDAGRGSLIDGWPAKGADCRFGLDPADTLRAPMKNVVILISGRGSNMEAIVRACADERWQARIAAVVSNRADAAGLGFARDHGIATEVVDHRAFASREAFDEALAGRIEGHGADVVVLAGFMRILGAAFVRRFDGRLVNIHPSLLPAFPGLETHRRALEAGCKATGATVHFVTAELDHGPIIAQAVVPVRADDDAATLSARVLAQEHRLYPRAIAWLLDGRLERVDGIVRHRDGVSQLLLGEA
jgi:phosphoribosylglycinamide formyltransferase-1